MNARLARSAPPPRAARRVGRELAARAVDGRDDPVEEPRVHRRRGARDVARALGRDGEPHARAPGLDRARAQRAQRGRVDASCRATVPSAGREAGATRGRVGVRGLGLAEVEVAEVEERAERPSLSRTRRARSYHARRRG